MESILTGKVDRAPIPYEEKARYWAETVYSTAAALVAAYARAEKRGINQEVIADRLEKDKAQISRWLSGERNMTIKSISEMALAMECDLRIELKDIENLPIPNYSYSLPIAAETSSRSGSDTHLTSDEGKTFGGVRNAITFNPAA
jgi:transcriptional regulator with XRE-family HTH domain